uniref:cilia- and flagella-associated protein 47-like isoform X2 n=1 Tax=Pristiophorus japonicus TaxID=55135 RepID=UPI00398E85F1
MDIAGVRISHSVVKFISTEPGEIYRATLTVQNISNNSRLIHIYQPKHKLFRIIVKNSVKRIAPGVQIAAIVEYSTAKKEDATDNCIITADEDTINIPLLAFGAACDLSIDPEVDFGTVVANSKVISKEINVENHGSLPGQFIIVDKGNLPITFIPRNGIVLPETLQSVKVELCTHQPMVLDKMVLVQLEGVETTLKIKANIVEPVLELFDLSGQKIECIQFGGAYSGTSKQEQVILYNNSPEAIDWVTVMENDAAGSEVGTDLSLSADAVLADKDIEDPRLSAYTSALIMCRPCQGTLNPYNKTIVNLCFSPKELRRTKFQRKEDEIPKYREYALYVRFETVRSCDGFIQKSSSGSNERKDRQQVELTLTGTGFPVNLNISPTTEFDFKECLLGEKVNVKVTLRNDSPLLPLIFQFHKAAHFQVTPIKGKIKSGQSKDIVICFAAHQLGTFKVNQVIDFYGLVLLPNNPVTLKMQSFHQIKITLMGVCKSTMKILEPKLIPRMTPAATKETRLLAQETTDQISKYSDSSPVTLLCGSENIPHSQNRSKNLKTNAFVSIPDGSNKYEKYIASSTKMKKHSYVDPEYTHNDEEVAAKKAHKKHYEHFIQDLRLHRLQKQDHRNFEEYNNAKDIGMRSAEGLRSPKLSVKDIIEEKCPLRWSQQSRGQPIRTRKPTVRDGDSTARPGLTCSDEGSMSTSDHSSKARDGLNAVPSSLQEEKDCSLTLRPQQLHQIFIGPSTIDFGTVCVYSTSMQNLNIVNNLPTHVLIEVDTDCAELRESSPLSQVIPPMSAAYLPLIFETILLGVFQKSITYKINNIHIGHVLVLANVVCVALELSSSKLVLTPNYGLLAESGFRTTVRLYNRRNYPAQFSWNPVLTEKGIAFFIRPDGGIVDAFNDLECEVVWHASFFSPAEGEFELIVHHGNKLRLKCIAKLGHVNVHFVENRVLFKAAPWNLSTMKTAVLKNYGQNHAYFKVNNVNPVPGMTITPAHGTIPVGGHVCFTIFFHPTTVFKFDIRIKVDIRNTNPVKLRVGGSVIRPMAEIDVKYFMFYGVYCGSTCMIPFTLLNLTESYIKLEFDLSNYKDFALKFEADPSQDSLNPQLYAVVLGPKESIRCELSFTPTEVASYDFNLPVNMNGSTSPSPPPSSVPNDPYDDISIDSSQVQILSPATPSHRVQATALSPPLELSTTKVEFSLLPGYNDLGAIAADPFVKKIEIENISNKEIKWMLDLNSQENTTLEEGIFRIYHYNGSLKPGQRHCITVGFCPQCPGKYMSEIPMYLNEDRTSPYQVISLSGIIHTPELIIDPSFVTLNTVPLGTETTATVRITALNYLSDCTLKAEIPGVANEDGDWFEPLSCQFPEGSTLAFKSETIRSITCCITFCSFSPISISMNITFIDQDKKRYKLPVSASTDNCLLTLYRYLALHHTDQQIVLKTANNSSKQSIGKVVLQPYYTPEISSHSTSTITTFSASSSVLDESVSATCESGDSKVEKKNTEDESDVLDRKNNLGELLFSTECLTEETFCEKVITAVQTWFSLFGWSNGMHPISIPESLRSTKQVCKDTETIYDMLYHLSGQQLPGLTTKQSLPSDPVERILQLHWQYSTLLTFLRAQGACLAHVKPAFLFDPTEFKQWNQLQSCAQSTECAEIFDLDDDVFESISKHSWTDMLLQIYKVLVLSRLTMKDINSIFGNQKCLENVPRINAEPLSSNIYSTGERVLLTWLNFHYETMRSAVWECCLKGAVPSTRWIINFDLDLLDGLVLAAVLAAYCPDLIPTHFENMYTSPATPEQCLHNSLVLLNAFYAIGLDFDIQATDISDPNPIMMLMLCVYLYERLPSYLPKMTVEFTGDLHATIVKQVRLQNPITRRIVYFATIVGKEATDFSLPNGNKVTVPPRSHVDVSVEFTSRFLNPEKALLVFVSRMMKGVQATTTTFLLTSRINNINPTAIVKCESPCYEQKQIQLNITNPLNGKGDFRVILMVSRNSLFETEDVKCFEALLAKLKMQNQKNNLKFSEPDEFENSKGNVFENGVDDPNMGLKDSFQTNWVPEFFSKVTSLHLEARGSSVLEVFYLPFHIGQSYCTIFLVNEQIGEFLYCLEGTGCLPLPSTGLQVFSPSAIQNHCADSGYKNATQIVLYYKCNNTCTFDQELKIPLINEAREKALATVGQQQMSQIEYKRRKIAGTLESSSVRASVAALGLSCIQIKMPHSTKTDCTAPKTIDYCVEISMPKRFESPDKISIPVTRVHRVNSKSQQTCGSLNLSETVNLDKENSAIMPMKFISKGPGRYPCQILLWSPYDIRLYNITCVVNPEDCFETELEIAASTHQSVIKNIPVHNETQEDWKIKAVLEGKDFFGPSMLNIQACETSMYPLMFKPNFECVTMGKLVLVNETDGTERIVNLKGIGKKPVAVDHVVIDCQVKQITKKVLMVPNYTQTRLTCKVVSDLLIVSGEPFITLKAGQTAPYMLNILPWKRGRFTGVISFVVEDETRQLPDCSTSVEKSDGEQPVTNVTSMACEAIGGANSEKNILYRVWFYLEINTIPAPPEQCLCVTCAVQENIDVPIPICNPIDEPLTLDVMLNGAGITGDTCLVIKPKEVISYMARYTPSVVGESNGRWTRQFIPLANSTDETLKLGIVNSNPGIFLLEIDPRKLLIVNPQSTTEVPVQFSPSTLGKANHCATIIFKCPQLQEWTFHLSGVGLLPRQMDPVSISACVKSHASVIVPFENPTNEPLLVDVVLTDNEQVSHHHSPSDLLQSINKELVFCIPLKQNQDILLPPKGKLDIPLIFAPDDMALYEALMVVQIKKQNGNSWSYEMSEVTAGEQKSFCTSAEGDISGIRWRYPIYGIPEALPTKLYPAVIQCQARNRIENPIEVILTGAVPSCSYTAAMQTRATTPNTCDQEVTNAGQTTAEEFFYEIQYETEKARIQMESTVAISFVKKKWDTETGIVTLTFNIVFAPYKPISHPAMLKVQSVTGGIWKFPLLLIATEPQVDDVINIEAAGLNKEAVVCFRLTSQTRYPIPFTAHFLPCSDQEFVVSPQTGELLPLGSTGTLITIGFTPRMYSRKHKAKLLVQTVDMQWMYEINGLDPQYTPPNLQCGKTITTAFRHSLAVRQRNFIRENLNVITTAVSSPLKGAPLLTTSKASRTK